MGANGPIFPKRRDQQNLWRQTLETENLSNSSVRQPRVEWVEDISERVEYTCNKKGNGSSDDSFTGLLTQIPQLDARTKEPNLFEKLWAETPNGLDIPPKRRRIDQNEQIPLAIASDEDEKLVRRKEKFSKLAQSVEDILVGWEPSLNSSEVNQEGLQTLGSPEKIVFETDEESAPETDEEEIIPETTDEESPPKTNKKNRIRYIVFPNLGSASSFVGSNSTFFNSPCRISLQHCDKVPDDSIHWSEDEMPPICNEENFIEYDDLDKLCEEEIRDQQEWEDLNKEGLNLHHQESDSLCEEEEIYQREWAAVDVEGSHLCQQEWEVLWEEENMYRQGWEAMYGEENKCQQEWEEENMYQAGYETQSSLSPVSSSMSEYIPHESPTVVDSSTSSPECFIGEENPATTFRSLINAFADSMGTFLGGVPAISNALDKQDRFFHHISFFRSLEADGKMIERVDDHNKFPGVICSNYSMKRW